MEWLQPLDGLDCAVGPTFTNFGDVRAVDLSPR